MDTKRVIRLIACALLLTVFPRCDDGSSARPADIEGFWAGQETSMSATGSAACFVTALNAALPLTGAATFYLTQSDANIGGYMFHQPHPLVASSDLLSSFAGSVDGDDVRIHIQGGWSTPATLACPDFGIVIAFESGDYDGRFAGGRLELDATEQFRVFRVEGRFTFDIGDLTLTGRLSLAR